MKKKKGFCRLHHKKTVLAACAAVIAFCATMSFSAELVVNGGFDEVMVNWSLDDALGSWIPYEYPAGTVLLHPSTGFGYRGTLFSQALNIDSVASETVDVSIDLGCDWEPPPGNTIAVYLEYLDTGGLRQRINVLNPANTNILAGSMTTYSTPYTFPSDAVKLVGIAIDKMGDAYIHGDNVSLSSSSLSSGPIPHLVSISPSAIPYGGTLVIKGSNFGAVQSDVLIGGSTNGVTIQSWTPGMIELTIGPACTGGNVQVDAHGPRTCEKRNLTITSPYFGLVASPESSIALAGQQVQIDVRASFFGGFSNDVQLTVPEASTAATFSPNPVTRDGGSLLTFDTTGLSPGIHTFTALGQATDSPDRSTSFTIDIREVASFTCDADGSTFTAQGSVSATTTITDTLGNNITFDIPRPTWTSSNPTAIGVFQETSPWGSLYFLPHATGSATLRATLPGGSYYDVAVSAVIPASPSVITYQCLYPTMSNDPVFTNQLYLLASGPMSKVSFSISDLGLTTFNSTWNGDNSSHTYYFTIGERNKPGTYMFRGGATVSGVSVSDDCLLQVVNNPATGLIKGHVAQFGGAMMEHGASGFLEFYDAGTGAPAFTNDVWEWTANYTVPSVPPGTYKLRFTSGSGLSMWFPNASTNIDATAVVIAAGATVENINFTLSSSGSEPNPPITTPPSYDPTTGKFSFAVQTAEYKNYSLQKSASMKDGSWYVLQSFWAYSTSTVVEDTNTVSSSGFYRVVPE
jgi:hypothetical protein